jgi:hypothetical protein
MILTPISLPDLPRTLADYALRLGDAPLAAKVFGRIAGSLAQVDGDDLELSQDPDQRSEALDLCRSFGMGVTLGPPPALFTYDGRSVRGDMEPSVIVHEVAHIQACAPERRHVIDFGLGAGPETIDRDTADAAMSVFGVDREMEEAVASLLGILWEVELGHPAILAFLEQNWLEAADRPQNRAHFLKILGCLSRHGLIDAEGRPTRVLRDVDDAAFLGPLSLP